MTSSSTNVFDISKAVHAATQDTGYGTITTKFSPPTSTPPPLPELGLLLSDGAKELGARMRGIAHQEEQARKKQNAPPSPAAHDSTFMDRLEATLRTDNSIGSLASSETIREQLEGPDTSPLIDPDGVYDKAVQDGMIDNITMFTSVRTQRDYDVVVAQIKRERMDRKLMAASGPVEGFGMQVIAAVLDPVSYIPFFGQGAKVVKVGKAFTNTSRVARTASDTAIRAAGGAAIQEATLQATQVTRTKEETGLAIAFSTVLGGVLGGGVGAHRLLKDTKLSKERIKANEEEISDLMSGDFDKKASLSAAAVMDDYTVGVNTARAATTSKASRAIGAASDFSLRNPVFGLPIKGMRNTEIDALNSPSPTVRNAMLRILNVSRITEDNAANNLPNPTGTGTNANVSDIVRAYRGSLADAINDTDRVFHDAGGGRLMKSGSLGLYHGRVPKIRSLSRYGSRDDIAKRVYRAMLNGDVDEHGDKVITALAQSWRKKVFDPVFNDLVDAKVLSKENIDLKGDKGYVTRIYDRPEIIKRSSQFIDMLTTQFKRELDDEFEAAIQTRSSRNTQASEARSDASLKAKEATERAVTSSKAKVDEVETARTKALEELETQRERALKARDERRNSVVGAEKDGRKRRGIESQATKQLSQIVKFYDAQLKTITRQYDDLVKRANDVRAQAIAAAKTAEKEARKAIPPRKQPGILKHNTDDKRLAQAKEQAAATYRRIVDTDNPHQDYELSAGVSGFTKARSINIPSRDMADAGFLKDNVFDIAQRYVRTAGTDAALSKVFRRIKLGDGDQVADEFVGDPRLEGVIGKLGEDAKFKIDDLRAAGKLTPEREIEIMSERNDAVHMMETVRKRLRGEFVDGDFALTKSSGVRRVADGVLALNFVTKMGGTVLSSLGDISTIAMVNGFGKTISKGFIPVMREATKSGIRDSDNFRLARLTGANIELAMNSRFAAMSGLDDPLASFSPAQKFIENATQTFSKFSGITHWNTFMKQVAYNTTQSRFLENAIKGHANLSNRERAFMNNLGLDARTLKAIKEQHAQQPQGALLGVKVAMWDKWSDKAAADKMRAALGREVNNQVITPEQLDMPTYYNTVLGRVMLQFRSHMIASQARIVSRNVQLAGLGDDASENMAGFYTGMAGMLAMGVVVEYAKYVSGSMTPDGTDKRTVGKRGSNLNPTESWLKNWEENPTQSFFNAVDRSSLSPILTDWDAMSSKLVGVSVRRAAALAIGDKNVLKKDGTPARLRNREPLSVVGGPTVGLASDALSATSGLSHFFGSGFDQTLTRSQFRSLRNLAPYQNAIPIQQLFNGAEAGLAMTWDFSAK